MVDKIVDGQPFWDAVERELQIEIPSHLKFIFKLQSVDNPLITELEENDLIGFEEFVTSDSYRNIIATNSNLEQYYGNYSPKEFRFSDEDKRILAEIKSLISEKDSSFWIRKPKYSKDAASTSKSQNSLWKSSTFLDMLQFSYADNIDKNSQGHRFRDTLYTVLSFNFVIIKRNS